MFADTKNPRHPLARAEFFLALAEKCLTTQLSEFEAYLEASIIFARSAMHRLETEFEKHPEWKAWFKSMDADESVNFFRNQRDFILKECAPPLVQIVNSNVVARASELRRFDGIQIDAASHVRSLLNRYSALLLSAEQQFRTGFLE